MENQNPTPPQNPSPPPPTSGPVPAQPATPPPPPPPPPSVTPSAGGKNKGLLIVAVVLTLLVILLGALYYFILKQSYQASTPVEQTVAQPTITPTPTAGDEQSAAENITIEDPTNDLNQIDTDLQSL